MDLNSKNMKYFNNTKQEFKHICCKTIVQTIKYMHKQNVNICTSEMLSIAPVLQCEKLLFCSPQYIMEILLP